MSHPKTAGRELALQYLYMHDVLEGKDVQPFSEYASTREPLPEKQSVEFGEKLVSSVLKHRDELDAEISEVATNWNIKRMAAVDRNILRLSLAELTVFPETTHKIILDEAVELAKQYSSEEAPAFVNGLLDKLSSKLRPNSAECRVPSAE